MRCGKSISVGKTWTPFSGCIIKSLLQPCRLKNIFRHPIVEIFACHTLYQGGYKNVRRVITLIVCTRHERNCIKALKSLHMLIFRTVETIIFAGSEHGIMIVGVFSPSIMADRTKVGQS